jgi:hypothetical protein
MRSMAPMRLYNQPKPHAFTSLPLQSATLSGSGTGTGYVYINIIKIIFVTFWGGLIVHNLDLYLFSSVMSIILIITTIIIFIKLKKKPLI